MFYLTAEDIGSETLRNFAQSHIKCLIWNVGVNLSDPGLTLPHQSAVWRKNSFLAVMRASGIPEGWCSDSPRDSNQE